ncbi:MAG: acyl carrier protein [Clostridia bacterium]|nr:acyl carrier protein [Clostridia bacterium]
MAKPYTKAQIAEKVKEIVVTYVPELADTELKNNTTLSVNDGIDSMNILLVITKLEAFYGIEIPDRKWRKLQTFGDVVDAIYDEL